MPAVCFNRWQRPSGGSNLRRLSEQEGIFQFNAEISNRHLDLGMAKQNLDCAEVTGALLDDPWLGPPERVGALVFLLKPDRGDPLVDQSCILPRAEVIGGVHSAREHEICQRVALALPPLGQAVAGGFRLL